MSEPSDWVRALAAERAGYLRGGKPERIAPVDEELAREGWCVDGDGDVIPLGERSDPAPRSRRGPRKSVA